ncbi:sensor histidine kinase [Streptomyces sp. GC420]|uniref:sensor histidine kinase n=1 Tax=Streptomyces sp. GC420 TaxID=2697568 RepID=UPI0037DA1640
MLDVTPLAAGQGRLARARVRLHRHPLALDAATALGVLVVIIVGSFAEKHGRHGTSFGGSAPEPSSLMLAVLASAALILRRRDPIRVLVFTCAVTLVELITGDPRAPVFTSVVIALYTVAVTTDRQTTWRAALPVMTGLTAVAMYCGAAPWYTQDNLAIFAWTGMAAAAGDAVRHRRDFVDAIRERAERAERTREEEARRRVAEERLRIARDLHDVVAHHIALVNVQAGVAAHVMDKRPDQAKEALAHVREASRSALGELRATVGLLRQSGDPEAPTEPTPGLGGLDHLADSFRRAGLPVEVARADEGAPLPASVDLAAYRVIQEALTNVRKHAGAGAKAEVSVVRVGHFVEITVLDDGGGAGGDGRDRDRDRGDGREAEDAVNDSADRLPAQRSRTGTGPAPGIGPAGTGPGPGGPDARAEGRPPGGHGLLGMRERATALGGSCHAGPRYGGGFRVQVILPLTTRARTGGSA